MRTTLLALLILFPAVAVASSFWFTGELKSFLRQVPRLESAREIERLKTVVARQMIAALVQIGLLGAPAVLYAFGFFTGALGAVDLLYVLLPALVVMGMGARGRPIELAVRNMPTASDDLTGERDRIAHTWVKKALPDW
jgi:hypothetical protein